MIPGQNYNIIVLNSEGQCQLAFSDQLEKQNPLVKQKMLVIAREIYALAPEADKKAMTQIKFTFIENDKLEIKLSKGDVDKEFDLSQLNDEAQLRSLELIRLVHEIGIDILAAEEQPSLSPRALEFQAKVPTQPTPKINRIARLFRRIHRWIVHAFVMRSPIQNFAISHFQSCQNAKELKKKWQRSEKAVQELAEQIYLKVNRGRSTDDELFSLEEINDEIQKLLSNQFAASYNQLTGEEISLQGMRLLKNEKAIQEAASRFAALAEDLKQFQEKEGYFPLKDHEQYLKNFQEVLGELMKKRTEIVKVIEGSVQIAGIQEIQRKALAESEEEIEKIQKEIAEAEKGIADFENLTQAQLASLHEAQEKWKEVIDGMAILDIPLEKLAHVPMTLFTEDSLAYAWEIIVRELIEQGNLRESGEPQDRAEAIKRARYADAYLQAYQLLPKDLKLVLKPLTDEIDTQKLQDFIWSQPQSADFKSLPPLDRDQKKQHAFQSFLKPFMEKTLDKLRIDNNDFLEIAKVMTDRHSPFLEEWSEIAISRLEMNGIHEEERIALELTKEELTDLMMASLEELAVNSYYLSGDQLIRLKQARTELEEQREQGKLADGLLSEFKARAAVFEKNNGSLETKIAAEAKRTIHMKMQIPDLEIPLNQLDKEEFERYIEQQEAEIKSIQTQISDIRQKQGKKAIIPHYLQTGLRQLREFVPTLKKALGEWERKDEIIGSSNLMATMKGTVRNLDTLSAREIGIVQDNIERIQKRVDALNEASNVNDNKALQQNKELLKRLQRIVENPAKEQERQAAIATLQKQKVELLEELSQYLFAHFIQFPFLELTVSKLVEVPVTEANAPVMTLLWESLLQELSESSSKKGEWKYLEAVKALDQLQAPAIFKEAMLDLRERLEIPDEATTELLKQFAALEEMDSDFKQKIQEEKGRIPSPKTSIPSFTVSWEEAAPQRLEKLHKAKGKEIDALEEQIQKQQAQLNETQSNIKGYAKTKDPKIKRKGGLQILQKKEKELEAKLQKKRDALALIQEESNLLKTLLSGGSNESAASRTLMVNAHQGSIEELSADEWALLEKELKDAEALPREEQETLAKYMEERGNAIKQLLDVRDRIAEGVAALEKLEKERTVQARAVQAEIEARIFALDSAEVQVRALAKLPVTPLNEELVANLWKGLILQCLTEGELETIDPSAEQEGVPRIERFASQYLAIRNFLGKTDDPKLQLLKEEVNQAEASGEDKAKQALEERLKAFIGQQAAMRLAEMERLTPQVTEWLFGSIQNPPAPTALKAKKNEAEPFDPYEIENLKLLTKALELAKTPPELTITQDEKDQIYAFVAFAKENSPLSKSLNGKLSALTDRKSLDMKASLKEMLLGMASEDIRPFKKIPYGISQEAVELAMILSYNFKTPEMFAPLVDRFEITMAKIELGHDISAQDKFTRRELGLLQKCAKLGRDNEEDEKGVLAHLEALGVLERDPALEKLHKLSKQTEVLMERAQKVFASQIDYQDGDLVANVGRQKLEIAGRKPNGEEEIHFRLVTPYCHGAKIFKENDKVMQSHVMGNYIQDEFTLSEELYSEVWRLDVAALMPKKIHDSLKELYGEDWQSAVQEKYQAIENHIQKNKKGQFSDLKNPWDRRISAGKADYLWGGHRRKQERDFERLADKMLAETGTHEERMTIMICSEFVTKTTLAALVKLNRELSQELGDHLIKKGETDEGEKLKAQRNVFELPYSKKEKLKYVHPGRMIDLLVDRRCIKQIAKPKIIGQLLRV